jgi:hypothetical protein
MVLGVKRPHWNNVELAASIFGLDMTPDRPSSQPEHSTIVEISGSLTKLQQVLSAAGKGPVLIRVAKMLPNGLRG